MEIVKYKDFCKGKLQKGWTFEKVFPSIENTFSENEIWISEERLRIPVGKKKVFIKFFKWVSYNVELDIYECSLGIVPDYNMLDQKAVDILNRLTKNKLSSDPYYHLLNQSDYRDIFLRENQIKKDSLEEVLMYMDSSLYFIERNLIYYLEGGSSRIKDTGERSSIVGNGWAVLVRARSGSI